MSKIEIEPTGRFSAAFKEAVEASGMSLTELAQKVDSTYEHMRKLVGGRAHPSVHLLRALATTLKTNKDEWSELIEADKLHKRYKHLPKFLGQSAEMEQFETVIPKLSKENQEILLQMGKTLLKQQQLVTNHKGR